MRYLKLGIVLLTMGVFSGCATLVHGPKQNFEVQSNPPGARVFLDHLEIGETPLRVELERKKKHQLEFRDSLNRWSTVWMQQQLNPWLLANLFGLGYAPVGMAVDWISGSRQRLKPTVVLANPALEVSVAPVRQPRNEKGVYGGVGMEYFGKQYTQQERHDTYTGTDAEIAVSAWIGKKTWPVDFVAKTFLVSGLDRFGAHERLSLGIQKMWHEEGPFRPLAQAGVQYTQNSTQGNQGLPLGIWGNVGAELQVERMGFGLLAGYAKGETTNSEYGTGGLRFGGYSIMLW